MSRHEYGHLRAAPVGPKRRNRHAESRRHQTEANRGEVSLRLLDAVSLHGVALPRTNAPEWNLRGVSRTVRGPIVRKPFELHVLMTMAGQLRLLRVRGRARASNLKAIQGVAAAIVGNPLSADHAASRSSG